MAISKIVINKIKTMKMTIGKIKIQFSTRLQNLRKVIVYKYQDLTKLEAY